MDLLFYTDTPADDALFLKNGLIYSSGQPLGPACRALVRDPELAQSCASLFIPLCPSLEEVCAAYLLSAASSSGKLPRAAAALADFLEALPDRSLPFTRESVDTLPFLHSYLFAHPLREQNARRAVDTLFTVLRQLMMDLLLFGDFDPATRPLSPRVPSVAPITAQALTELDRYISDCARGRELTLSLPAQDGSVLPGRALLLDKPSCRYPALFAGYCGFSLLTVKADLLEIYPLDCSRDCLVSLLKANGGCTARDDSALVPAFDDPEHFISLLSSLACTGCTLRLSAAIAPGGIKNLPDTVSIQGIPLSCRVLSSKRGKRLVLTGTPPLIGKSFHYALENALALRTRLADADISDCADISFKCENAVCDLFIQLPVDCLEQYYPDCIAFDGGKCAVTPGGIIALSDELPADEVRDRLLELEQLEQRVSAGPVHALRTLSAATALCSFIALSRGFTRAVFEQERAGQRAESVRLCALMASDLINTRRSFAVILTVCALLCAVLCALPFMFGLFDPKRGLIPYLISVAVLTAAATALILHRRKKRPADGFDAGVCASASDDEDKDKKAHSSENTRSN